MFDKLLFKEQLIYLVLFALNGLSDMFVIERHTDGDTVLLLPALYSIDIKKL